MSPVSVRRTALRILALLVFIALAGATYQGVATALERREFPKPGRMVDVGGHQLHIHCVGKGTPIVVLEAPAAGLSAAWGWVQPDVAKTTRVCAYDRAGLGWSESREGGFQPGAMVDELHGLLKGAGELGPYVMVGQGLGASLVEAFAGRHGADVASLILVDQPSPARAVSDGLLVRYPALTPWLARVGVLRGFRMLSKLTEGMPPPWSGALATFLNRPDHLTRSARELARWDETVAFGTDSAIPAVVPVVRLTTAHAGKVSFLSREEDALPVVTAIRHAVTTVRGS